MAVGIVINLVSSILPMENYEPRDEPMQTAMIKQIAGGTTVNARPQDDMDLDMILNEHEIPRRLTARGMREILAWHVDRIGANIDFEAGQDDDRAHEQYVETDAHVAAIERVRDENYDEVYDWVQRQHLRIDAQAFMHMRNQNQDQRPNIECSVYNDYQNVHASSVSKSVIASVQSLIQDPEPDVTVIQQQIRASVLKPSTITALIDFCGDRSVHSGLGLTFAQMLAYVWQRIHNPSPSAQITTVLERTNELLRILEQRVEDCFEDGKPLCFFGRFNRILSTLDGFFDDIRITISDSEQITAIVLQIQNTITPYDKAVHKRLVIERFEEEGLESKQYQAWIDAIDDGEPDEIDAAPEPFEELPFEPVLRVLLRNPRPAFTPLMIPHEPYLSPEAQQLLIAYCDDPTVHEDYLVTYRELLSYVWDRIVSSDRRTELFQNLNVEVMASAGLWFTDRFGMSLSVIAGLVEV